MITKGSLVKYTIDAGVIPVSNDRNRFPLRAQYGRRSITWRDTQFAVLLKTELFTHHKKTDYTIHLDCTCFVCDRTLMEEAMNVGYLYCSSAHISRSTKRDLCMGSIQALNLMPTNYPVTCKYIIEDRQPYLVYVHTMCYEKYQLSPLGYNLEDRTRIIL